MIAFRLAMVAKKKATKGDRPQLSARVAEPLLVRLGVYLAKNRDLTQQEVVADALDEYLKKRGA